MLQPSKIYTFQFVFIQKNASGGISLFYQQYIMNLFFRLSPMIVSLSLNKGYITHIRVK